MLRIYIQIYSQIQIYMRAHPINFVILMIFGFSLPYFDCSQVQSGTGACSITIRNRLCHDVAYVRTSDSTHARLCHDIAYVRMSDSTHARLCHDIAYVRLHPHTFHIRWHSYFLNIAECFNKSSVFTFRHKNWFEMASTVSLISWIKAEPCLVSVTSFLL